MKMFLQGENSVFAGIFNKVHYKIAVFIVCFKTIICNPFILKSEFNSNFVVSFEVSGKISLKK